MSELERILRKRTLILKLSEISFWLGHQADKSDFLPRAEIVLKGNFQNTKFAECSVEARLTKYDGHIDRNEHEEPIIGVVDYYKEDNSFVVRSLIRSGIYDDFFKIVSAGKEDLLHKMHLHIDVHHMPEDWQAEQLTVENVGFGISLIVRGEGL